VLLATAVAVLHAAAVLFMLTGALLAVRRPWLVVVHAPVALAILGVNLAGADCPLTTLELQLRERAGQPPYDDGFLGHHLFGPLGLDVAATGTQLGVYSAAFGLNALGYALVLTRALRRPQVSRPVARAATRRSARGRGRRPRGPRSRTPGPPAAAHPAGRRTSSRTSAPARR
jgi:hypothetical protein